MTTMRGADLPDKPLLREFLLGRVSEDQARQIEWQLTQSEIPLADIDGEVCDDFLLQQLRHVQRPPADPPEMKRLISRLESLRETSIGGSTLRGFDQEQFTQLLEPAIQPDEIGRLGEFRILGILGAGGMGVVFEAEDERLSRRLAVKVLSPHLASSPAARDRFLREARAAAAIEHDHVVSIYQTNSSGGIPLIVMPLLKGESLQDRCERDGAIPFRVSLEIGRQIALGLAAAHEKNLLHRDIKPANIWLEAPNSRAKILDFGLARICDDVEQLSGSAAIVGTPKYMAPEQVAARELDARCDLFSLGVVLYEMLTGNSPFAADTVPAILDAVAHKTPAPPQEIRDEVPRAVSAFVMSLLEKDPDQRAESAKCVADQLGGFLQHIDRRDDLPRSVTPSSRKLEKHSFARRHSLPIFLLGVICLASLLWLLLLLNGDGLERDAISLSPRPVADDREVLAFAVSKGATCHIEIESGEGEVVASIEEIPQERCKILSININTGSIWDDEDISQLQGLQHIDSLQLLSPASRLSPEGFRSIASLDSLTSLVLFSPALTDEGVAQLGQMKQLRRLEIAGARDITDAGVAHLKSLSRLESLKLLHTSLLSDVGLQYLAELPSLAKLELRSVELTDHGLMTLARIGTLQSLVIDVPRVTDRGLIVLAGLENLKALRIYSPDNLTPEGVEELKSVLPQDCRVTVVGRDFPGTAGPGASRAVQD